MRNFNPSVVTRLKVSQVVAREHFAQYTNEVTHIFSLNGEYSQNDGGSSSSVSGNMGYSKGNGISRIK